MSKMIRKSVDSEMWRESILPVKIVTAGDQWEMVDLAKLLPISPLLRSVVQSLNVPDTLSHLLDISLILPDFDLEVFTCLVAVIDGESVIVNCDNNINGLCSNLINSDNLEI